MARVFLPWELNHLRKYGFAEIDPVKVDTTPVEYFTSHTQFRGLDFYVTPDCLIPRIETEKIVNLACDHLMHLSEHLEIADVGCGSGALGISLAHELEKRGIHDFRLFLSDISPAALDITRKNINLLVPQLKNKLIVLQSDLLGRYPKNTKLNCLLANLPYIPTSRLKTLDSSVKDHEPMSALDGGPDGTFLINRLLDQAIPFLSNNPILIFEIDYKHKLTQFHTPPILSARIEKDDFDHSRYLILQKQ